MIIQYNLDNWQFKTRENFLDTMNAELTNVKASFFKLGMYLSEAYVKRYNNGTGVDDFFEWLEDVLGLQKSSVYNLMRIYNVFRDKKRTDVGILDEKFADYSQSQLVELLPAAERLEKISFITPKDSVATIRKVVKISSKMQNRAHVDCESSEEYIGRFGAVLINNSPKKEKLKGADAFNKVYTVLNNEFDIEGWTARNIAKRIVYEILDL